MNRRCNGKQFCDIKADSPFFRLKSDPCYGTKKKLEVEFQCKGNEEHFRTIFKL